MESSDVGVVGDDGVVEDSPCSLVLHPDPSAIVPSDHTPGYIQIIRFPIVSCDDESEEDPFEESRMVAESETVLSRSDARDPSPILDPEPDHLSLVISVKELNESIHHPSTIPLFSPLKHSTHHEREMHCQLSSPYLQLLTTHLLGLR